MANEQTIIIEVLKHLPGQHEQISHAGDVAATEPNKYRASRIVGGIAGGIAGAGIGGLSGLSLGDMAEDKFRKDAVKTDQKVYREKYQADIQDAYNRGNVDQERKIFDEFAADRRQRHAGADSAGVLTKRAGIIGGVVSGAIAGYTVGSRIGESSQKKLEAAIARRNAAK